MIRGLVATIVLPPTSIDNTDADFERRPTLSGTMLAVFEQLLLHLQCGIRRSSRVIFG
jgi:hypothetical protein